MIKSKKQLEDTEILSPTYTLDNRNSSIEQLRQILEREKHRYVSMQEANEIAELLICLLTPPEEVNNDA